ncbi:MAG: thioredoxin domain-containing protein [Chloroflexi bacterium]|nr:thioredoxin domain-containing protein [Chloroflexota bacterium]
MSVVLLAAVLLQVTVVAYLLAHRSASAEETISNGRAVTVSTRPDAARLGPDDARVAIIEFGDFQCPFCRALHPTLMQFVQQHRDVSLTYRYFPLPIHPAAQVMALAAECARRENKFWQAADVLYSLPADMSEQQFLGEGLPEVANGVGLPVEGLMGCVQDPNTARVVNGDKAEAMRLNILGTPALIIGSRLYVGNLPYSELQSIYEANSK